MRHFIVKAPATTSNMGPGFDCFGMALSLYNSAEFSFHGEGIHVSSEGFSKESAMDPAQNLIIRSFRSLCERKKVQAPENMTLHCVNRIPMGSGMGSSATAILMGIFSANAWGKFGMNRDELLAVAAEMEGHPDNAAPAIYGGFVSAITEEGKIHVHPWQTADWNLAMVVPHFDLSTHEAREALPKQVSLTDAVYNIAHMPFVQEALRCGDEALLNLGMRDRIHQSYRMALLPGSKEACEAAVNAGAAASGLSGAGPGVIAYTMGNTREILRAMENVYDREGLVYESFSLKISHEGVSVTEL